MTYNATYDTEDLNEIVVDGLGIAGAETIQWISLFILGMILLVLIGVFAKISAAFK